MARMRVLVKPFEDNGAYAADFVEITEDVELGGLSTIKQSLDNNEYDIGIFKNGGMNLTLNNLNGRYSEVGAPNSMFKFRRSNSLIRVTYNPNDSDLYAGFCQVGTAFLLEPDSADTVVFEGLLDDTALKHNADEQNLKLKVLGKESIFVNEVVPFSLVNAGDTFSQLIYKFLNQTNITNILTVSPSNLTCNIDLAADDVADLENMTVREALNLILLYSNSVLYIVNDVVYVSSRTPSADIKATFYGQGAVFGIENIIELNDFRMGLNRTFNYITWQDTDLLSQDDSSIKHNGVIKKEIQTTLITDDAKRQQSLDAIKFEFRNPRREFTIKIPLTLDTMNLKVLDRVAIDYPNVTIDKNPAIWDKAKWDVAVFPNEILPIEVEPQANFKIISKDVDPANIELALYLREI